MLTVLRVANSQINLTRRSRRRRRRGGGECL